MLDSVDKYLEMAKPMPSARRSPPVTWLAADLVPGGPVAAHAHPEGQLVFAVDGVVRVETDEGTWVVPPHRAVWVPGMVRHALSTRQIAKVRTLYVAAGAADGLPDHCLVLTVSPLLREIIVSLMQHSPRYQDTDATGRLVHVALDQIAACPRTQLFLPMPKDRRLQAFAQGLIDEPGSRLGLAEWAERCGMSVRSFARHVQAQTGLTFGQWRQQVRLMEAVARLGEGTRVSDVALDLGYESPSAFIAMFRRAFGVSPSKLLAIGPDTAERPASAS